MLWDLLRNSQQVDALRTYRIGICPNFGKPVGCGDETP